MAKKADGEPKVKKSDAMRAAIEQGIEKPQEASEFIKQKFGLDVKPQAFSAFKSIEKKKAGGSSGRKARVSTTAGASGSSAGNPAELARAVKQLVAAHGAEAVRDMVGVFEG